MSIKIGKRRLRKPLFEENWEEWVDDKGQSKRDFKGYKIKKDTKFTFAGKTYEVNDDYTFDINTKTNKISNTDLISNLPDLLELIKFNNTIYSVHNNKINLVNEDNINSFCIDYLKDLESESFLIKRFKSIFPNIKSVDLKSDIISFNNTEYSLRGEEINSNEEYLSKVSFNAELWTREDVENSNNLDLWEEYVDYVYGDSKRLFDINKTFSTIMWTDDLIKKHMKIIFNITDGGSGRTTIMNKLRNFCVLKQSTSLWKSAEHSRFQGFNELKHATQNLIDDPTEKKGVPFKITGDWLKDLTLEEFIFKGISKDALSEKNTVQNVVFLNKYNFDIDSSDYAEIRRLEWIEIRKTKDIRNWEKYNEFADTFDYEWLLSYLYYWLVDNVEKVLTQTKPFDIKKVQNNEDFEEFVNVLSNSPLQKFEWNELKKIVINLNWNNRNYKNKDFVNFFKKYNEELKDIFECKFYFKETKKNIFTNCAKSYIEKKDFANIRENVKLEQKEEDVNKGKIPFDPKISKKLKSLRCIEKGRRDSKNKYILEEGVIILDIEPTIKDVALSTATKDYLIDMLKPTIYSVTRGGLHLWYKQDINKTYVNNIIEEQNLKVEIKTKEIFVKDNYTINGELEFVEDKAYMFLKEKKVQHSSTEYDFANQDLSNTLEVIKTWNCRNGKTFEEVCDEYSNLGIERNNTLFNLRGWMLMLNIKETDVDSYIKMLNSGSKNPLSDNEIDTILRRR